MSEAKKLITADKSCFDAYSKWFQQDCYTGDKIMCTCGEVVCRQL